MTREEAIEVYHELLNQKIKEAFEVLAPEIKESEDEKMLRTIIRGFENWKSNGMETFNNTKVDDILAYLEKQKEQKDFQAKVERRMEYLWDKLPDIRKVVEGNCTPEELKTLGAYTELEMNFDKSSEEKQKEQNPAEWSKNDTIFLNEITDYFEDKTVSLQHDLEMYAHWLKSLPGRFNLQP